MAATPAGAGPPAALAPAPTIAVKLKFAGKLRRLRVTRPVDKRKLCAVLGASNYPEYQTALSAAAAAATATSTPPHDASAMAAAIGATLELSFCDEDGDRVTLSDPRDFAEAVDFFEATGKMPCFLVDAVARADPAVAPPTLPKPPPPPPSQPTTTAAAATGGPSLLFAGGPDGSTGSVAASAATAAAFGGGGVFARGPVTGGDAYDGPGDVGARLLGEELVGELLRAPALASLAPRGTAALQGTRAGEEPVSATGPGEQQQQQWLQRQEQHHRQPPAKQQQRWTQQQQPQQQQPQPWGRHHAQQPHHHLQQQQHTTSPRPPLWEYTTHGRPHQPGLQQQQQQQQPPQQPQQQPHSQPHFAWQQQAQHQQLPGGYRFLAPPEEGEEQGAGQWPRPQQLQPPPQRQQQRAGGNVSAPLQHRPAFAAPTGSGASGAGGGSDAAPKHAEPAAAASTAGTSTTTTAAAAAALPASPSPAPARPPPGVASFLSPAFPDDRFPEAANAAAIRRHDEEEGGLNPTTIKFLFKGATTDKMSGDKHGKVILLGRDGDDPTAKFWMLKSDGTNIYLVDPREGYHVPVQSPRGGYVRVRHEQFEYRYSFEFVPHPRMSHKRCGRYFVVYRRNAYIRQYSCEIRKNDGEDDAALVFKVVRMP